MLLILSFFFFFAKVGVINLLSYCQYSILKVDLFFFVNNIVDLVFKKLVCSFCDSYCVHKVLLHIIANIGLLIGVWLIFQMFSHMLVFAKLHLDVRLLPRSIVLTKLACFL
jgi:hypothetical protein